LAPIERMRWLSFAQSLFGNPAPLAQIPKQALRLGKCLFLSQCQLA
jgi:hypothetical protein